MRSTRRPLATLSGSVGFAIVVMAAMGAYFWTFTGFDSGYVKGTLGLIITVASVGSLEVMTRSLQLRVSVPLVLAALIMLQTAFLMVWLFTAKHKALDCWSCGHRDGDFYFTNGDGVIWGFIVFGISTACAAVVITVGYLLAGALIDLRGVGRANRQVG